MTEDQLLATIMACAKWLRLCAYHTYDSRKSPRGFPDVVAAGPGGVLFSELKSQYGDMSPDQTAWKYMLLAAGATWHLWRPSDWTSGRITTALRSLTRKATP